VAALVAYDVSPTTTVRAVHAVLARFLDNG
jgi:hypothetical protein